MQSKTKILPKTITIKSSFVYKMSFLFALTFAFVAIPRGTQAGVFSFLTSNKASAEIEVNGNTSNSQTLPILQVSNNTNGKSPNIIPVDKSGVLVADIAMSETINPYNGNGSQISLYVVRQDDTLSGIADMFDVSVNTIVWANDLERNSKLQIGQRLVILPVSGKNHTVTNGDTIEKLVKKYGADLDEVLKYNDITVSTTLKAGQTIIIPDIEMSIVQPEVSTLPQPYPLRGIDAPYYPGYYMRPVKGGVKTQGLHGFNAIDIAAPIGTPIYASAAGTVIVSKTGGWNGGAGNYIIIFHDNGTQTLYAHNSKNLVSVGQIVDKGDKIALMGAVGDATGSHLHFEIRGGKNTF